MISQNGNIWINVYNISVKHKIKLCGKTAFALFGRYYVLSPKPKLFIYFMITFLFEFLWLLLFVFQFHFYFRHQYSYTFTTKRMNGVIYAFTLSNVQLYKNTFVKMSVAKCKSYLNIKKNIVFIPFWTIKVWGITVANQNYIHLFNI